MWYRSGPIAWKWKTRRNIDLFAKKFKLPQVFKANFAVDQNCQQVVVSGRLFITIIVTYENGESNSKFNWS
jgi:hypothetical protein